MAYKTFIAVFAAAFFATSASAQTWTGPDESRRGYLFGHALENFETAITEVCFPFLLQNAEANTWIRNYRTYISWRPATGVFSGLTTYQVGGGSAANAGVGDRGAGRECTVEPDNRMDPAEAFTLVERLIARMPLQMTQSTAAFNPGAFERRITWCSPADGPQFAVLVSVAAVERPRNTPVMFVTFVEATERDPRCDVTAN